MSGAVPEYLALARAAKRGLHALIVDDHPVNRQVLSLMLERVPARVTCAENGADGVKAFKASTYDIVLMDLRMPGMDGFEAIGRIREIERARGLPRTPIIVVSAHDGADEIARAAAAGADEHIVKPVVPDLLLESIRHRRGQAAAQAAA